MLKKLENTGQITSKEIPYLVSNNVKIFNDKEKADIFAEHLAAIFQPYQDDIFNKEHKIKIENFVASQDLFNYQSTNIKFDIDFTLEELNKAIKKLKKKAAPGPDKLQTKSLQT